MLNKIDLISWYKLLIQYENGYHMEKSDNQELIRLNHLVMEATHKIHNDNMLRV
jgi:hypothetical protein